jgi:hypothetical protein
MYQRDIFRLFSVEKQSDEGEQYDDTLMDTSSLSIDKSSTARYVTPAKSG